MKRVYLIRHGLPDFPGGRGMCIGTTDIPMGEKGCAQAVQMAKKLPPVTAVFSSPLTRAVQTAQVIGMPVTLLDDLREIASSDAAVTDILMGQCWTAVETEAHFGMAMTTPVDTAPRMFNGDYVGMPLRKLAQTSKSWNLTEAGFGMAAVNAYYNTPNLLDALNAYEPFDKYCTEGVDLRGKHIGVVGHLNMPRSVYEQAASVRILERNPRPGDHPDSACDWLIPQCDVVIITASTLVNKTLPHLLDLSQNAYTILAGPSCPMCPELLNFGIDRIAGLVITDVDGMKNKIRREIFGPPYSMGKPFLLSKERL